MKADIFNLTKIPYVIALGSSINNLAAGILEPSVAPHLEILGASSQEIGTILSARFLVIAKASIPLALFASQIGLKRFLYISGFGTILAGISLYFIEGKIAIFLFYLSIGFTNAIFTGPCTALIAENTGTKRITAFSLLSNIWMIPSALGALISTVWFWNITNYTPDNLSSIFPLTVLLIMVGSTIFISLLLVTNHNESKESSEIHIPSNRVSIKNQFRLIFLPVVALPLTLLLFSEFLSGAGASSTLPYLTPYLKNLGATPRNLSILVFFMDIFSGIAVQLAPILSKKFGDLRVFTVTMLASILCLLGMIISKELWFSSMLYIFQIAFANMNSPISQSRMVNFIEARARTTGVATISTVRWISWSLVSPFSGRIIDNYGYNIAFTFTSIIYIISLVVFVYLVKYFRSLEETNSESN